MQYRSVAAVLSSLTIAALVPAAPAGAEPVTCQGKPVTTQGDSGTDGDDVMVVGPGQKSVSTGAGNDVVCIRLADDDTVKRYLYLDTGTGDDVVHNESTSSRRDVSVQLGAGADTFVGADTGEVVYAGPGGDTSDTERDVIDTRGGDDYVSTGSQALGAANPDVVATGTGDDRVEWAGQQVGGSLDLSDGDNHLTLVEGWMGDVAIDAPSGTVTAAGTTVLRWSGTVGDYDLTFPNLRTSFVGTDADERVSYWPEVRTDDGSSSVPLDPDRRLDIDLRGGDDRLDLSDSASGSMIGGAGRDMLHGAGWCRVSEVRLGSTYDCEVRRDATVHYSSTIDVWEKAVVLADEVHVVGSSGPDVIKVGGRKRIRLDGRGGDDVLTTIGSGGAGRNPRPAVVRGGAGDDELRGGHLADRLVGGPGDDLVRGNGGDDVVLGGAGRDRLFGGKGDDTLLGGAGRDRADGQKGRDRCVAEVRRSCERR